jgi:hypothetical protein
MFTYNGAPRVCRVNRCALTPVFDAGLMRLSWVVFWPYL